MADDRSAEIAIDEFLAQQCSWVRKFLQGNYALTPEERADYVQSNWPEIFGQAQDEYRELLKACPERLREYRALQKKLGAENGLCDVPAMPLGSPRKVSRAREIKELRQGGMSQSAIAREMNKRHPNLTDRMGNPRPITKEVVRKVLNPNRRREPAEKS